MSARRSRAAAADPPIVLSEHGGVRYLHFGSPWIQGAMRLRRPEALVFEYLQRMQAWLLLREPPARLAQFGLGAAGLARWALARLPDTALTVVEASGAVIGCAQAQFALPREHARLRLVHDDAEAFAARPAERGRYGVLQVDVYDAAARGPALDSVAFYAGCRAVLEPSGLAVFNLFNEAESLAPNRARIRDAFDGRVWEMPPVVAGNVIVLALAGAPLDLPAERLLARAQAVRARYGLAAVGWARQLLAAHGRQGRLQL